MAQLTISQALQRYATTCGPVTKTENLAIIRRYLTLGYTHEDASLGAYLREMAQRGYKPATLNRHKTILRAFYHALKIPAPSAKIRFDPLQDSDRVALSSEAMHTLMQAARHEDSGLDPYQRAILAVALVYGPRVNEIAAIQPQDVEDTRIYIRTSKGGDPRWLWVPELIRPILDIDWPSVSVNHVGDQFGIVWATVFGVEKPKGVGFHAIRRGLVRDLVQAGVPESAVGHFMRWAKKAGHSEYAMVAHYAQPNQSADGEGKAPVLKTEVGGYAEDELVWEKHPMLFEESL